MLLAAHLLCALSARALAPPDSSLPILGAAGAAQLRAGDYRAALVSLDSAVDIPDTCFHELKVGLAAYHTRQFSRALAAFQKVATGCSSLAACAFEHVAKMEVELGRTENALTAYRSALSSKTPQRYQAVLQREVTELVQQSGIDASGLAWLGPWFRPAPPETDSAQRIMVADMIAGQRWRSLDSLVGLALDSDAKREACGLLRLVPLDSVPQNTIDTRRLFDVAVKLRSCGSARAASAWLDRATSRSDFGRTVNPSRAVYLRGMLAYALGDNEAALKWLRRYERENAPSPEVIISIARAYRALGRTAKSGEWYDKHISLFPKHNQTHEILWYRAWQREEHGQIRTAIQLYRRIRQHYRNGSRAPESFFREGLLYLRSDKPDSALAVWDALLRSYPQSSIATAARYWKAKALLALERRPEAGESLRDVVAYDPLDYYSYRAQDFLRELGDTVPVVRFSLQADAEWARTWLDSIGEPAPLAAEDSVNYRAGIMLAAAGMAKHAEYYLDPLLLSYTKNLGFQFELASMLAFCDLPTLSYRAARPLAWRIPQERRAELPMSVFSVLYPRAFGDLIDRTAARFGLEPNLISAIIRQESIFDPEIVSPAGAIGLMQIMPFTGEDLARMLDEPFAPESLYEPATNVRFGAFYVRSLLERFNGNIVLVLAGYNGGPHNAKRWYEANRGVDFDTFIENISYTETRGYVKRVLANYWTYNRIARAELQSSALR